jgi:hypothetical protein
MNFKVCLFPINDVVAEAEPCPVGLEKVKLAKSLQILVALAKLPHRTALVRNCKCQVHDKKLGII